MPANYRTFPLIVADRDRRRYPDWPVSIPWRLVEGHEEQARNNTGRTLEELAAAGGLPPVELLAVITDQPFSAVEAMHPDDAVTELMLRGGIRRQAWAERRIYN